MIALSAVLLAFFAGFFILKAVSGPIRKLEKTARELGRGELGAKVDIKSNDEFGVLADVFNKMSSQLLMLVEKEKCCLLDFQLSGFLCHTNR